MGTGRVAGAVTFVRSAIFGPGGPRDVRNNYVSPRFAAHRRLSMTVKSRALFTGGLADDSGIDRGATSARA